MISSAATRSGLSSAAAALFGASVVGTMVSRLVLVRAASQLRLLRNSGRQQSTTAEGTQSFPKSSVYTRTGDKGTSLLFNGERRSKTDPVFEALGHQDELNVTIGIAREFASGGDKDAVIVEMLTEIQSRIFDLGAATATPVESSTANRLAYTAFSSEHTAQVENWIDKLDNQLPPLKNFILPSGGLFSTHLHLARSICRRAERATVILVAEGNVDAEVGKYLNRLSDFLFVASRYAAQSSGQKEHIWKKAKVLSADPA